jgi:hypothetical protein
MRFVILAKVYKALIGHIKLCLSKAETVFIAVERLLGEEERGKE